MTAYYNEVDPFAAAWLRNLIDAGHIAPGEVDDRSIEDVNPADLRGFKQCHFFAGVAIWSLALRQAGWPDDREVWTGSCPCQPFSAAGKGGGFADERHLWPAFHHLIRHRRPERVLGEQVASKDGLAWLDLVQADMEGEDYAFGAVDTCAAGFGSPHIRQRLYWVAERSSSKGLAQRLSDPGASERKSGAIQGKASVGGGVYDAQRMGIADRAGSQSGGGVRPPRPTDTGIPLSQQAGMIIGPARLTASGELLTGSDARMASGGQLNPTFSLWLMLGPFATAWARCAEAVTPSRSARRKGSSK